MSVLTKTLSILQLPLYVAAAHKVIVTAGERSSYFRLYTLGRSCNQVYRTAYCIPIHIGQQGFTYFNGSQLIGRNGIQCNETNIGYTRTANLGLRLAGDADVVLLNSDTVVGPHWLRNLKIAAYRRERIGSVTAVSDNAGAFSVPREGDNAMPPGASSPSSTSWAPPPS